MVSFELSEEERMVQQVAHEFAKKEIRPVAAHYDEHEEVPYDIIKKAAGLGFGVSKAGSVLDGASSSLIPSILPSTCSGTPDSNCSGTRPIRAGQFLRTNS